MTWLETFGGAFGVSAESCQPFSPGDRLSPPDTLEFHSLPASESLEQIASGDCSNSNEKGILDRRSYYGTLRLCDNLRRRLKIQSAIASFANRPRTRNQIAIMSSTTATETYTQPKPAEDETAKMLQAAEASHTKPLWLQMSRLNPPLPNPRCTPFLWKYSEIRPTLLQAGQLVKEHQAERRVLMLVNPSRGKRAEIRSVGRS